MRFFKSTKRKYAEQFLADGKLRVGSLYDFRRVEQYGEEVGDEGEGTKELYTDQRHITERTIPPFLRDRIRVGQGNRLSILIDGDGPVSAAFEDPDLYVFCVSLDFDEARMRQLGHDACIVIEGTAFFQHLHRAMKPHIRAGSSGVLRDVVYGPRRHYHDRDPGGLMAVVKPERFRYQREARALWYPSAAQPVEPFLYVHAPAAIAVCAREPILLGEVGA